MKAIPAAILTAVLFASGPIVRAQMNSGRVGSGQIGSGQLGAGQMGSGASQSTQSPFGSKTRGEEPPVNPAVQERIELGRQSERQKKMIADTDRLVFLANELKADMDKTTKDTLSIQVIRKAEEIEKLAHSVRERMKG